MTRFLCDPLDWRPSPATPRALLRPHNIAVLNSVRVKELAASRNHESLGFAARLCFVALAVRCRPLVRELIGDEPACRHPHSSDSLSRRRLLAAQGPRSASFEAHLYEMARLTAQLAPASATASLVASSSRPRNPPAVRPAPSPSTCGWQGPCVR